MKKDLLKKKIVRALENKSEEEIDNEFSELIRDELDDKQFWGYVSSWKDADNICREMEGWNTETKNEAIEDINEMFEI